MKRFLFFIFIVFLFYISLSAQPKHEIRAVWLTTNFGLDWPNQSIGNSSFKSRQKELYAILDKLQASNFNMVFIQTRLRGDVIYPSKIEPHSPYVNSNSDLLQLVVDACHERGMECHAWFVTYPLGSTLRKKKADKGSSTSKDYIKKYNDEYYMDPGNPETDKYLLSLITEIVSKYDIDGFHFDYIRYPEGKGDFPDKETYRKYGKNESLNSWRRKNINRFVYSAYDKIKEIKPWVQVSSSVLGMYEHIPGNSRPHWTAFGSVFQDPIDWISKGKHDFIVPMMYYTDGLFFPFVNNWTEHCNNRFVVPGIGVYRLEKNEGNWDSQTIIDQIAYSRENRTQGNVYFRTQQLFENKKNILNEITEQFYSLPAQLPALTWLDSIPPSPGGRPDAIGEGNYLHLSWNKHPDSSSERIYYSVYRSESYPVDITEPHNLFTSCTFQNELYIPINPSLESGYYYVITSNDRYHNESSASKAVYFCTGNFEK